MKANEEKMGRWEIIAEIQELLHDLQDLMVKADLALLKPDEPQGRCPECGGTGWFGIGYNHGGKCCPKCNGSGLATKDIDISNDFQGNFEATKEDKGEVKLWKGQYYSVNTTAMAYKAMADRYKKCLEKLRSLISNPNNAWSGIILLNIIEQALGDK